MIIKASQLDTLDMLFASEKPGAYVIDEEGKHLHWVCPCGCTSFVTIPISTIQGQQRTWHWDGNRDTPSIAPSIRRLDGCRWHGFLTNGMWNGQLEP